MVLYDGHCTSDAIQTNHKVAIIGAVIKGESLHVYGNASMIVSAERLGKWDGGYAMELHPQGRYLEDHLGRLVVPWRCETVHG